MAQTFSFEEALQPAALSKTSSFDAALQAEGVTGKLADVARSIYTQESGGGKNTKTSNAGAVGGMQIIPPTFASVADKDWDINNPEHNTRAGIRYLKQLDQQSGGDPALTAAGYYGGPGGMQKARKGIAVSDPRNPGAPNTLQYGQQVAARIPKGPIVQALDKVTDAIIPSASAEEMPGTKAGPAPATFSFEEAMAPAPGAAPAAPKRSMIEDLGRQLGLTVRAGVNGVAAIPAMAADAVTGPINAGLDAVAGKGEGFRFKSAGRSVNDLMTSAGLPQPESAQERVVQDAASAVAGAGGMIKGGMGLANYAKGPVTQAVGKMLSAGPGLQLASAATGAGASGVTREAGGGAGAQIAAGLAGGLAPGLAAPAAQSLARGALRGGEVGRQRIAKNLEAFEAAGVSPTLGQAAGGKLQRVESILGKAPGGAGIVANYADKQASDMAASVQRLSDELAPGANAMNAGEAISRGVNAFKEGMKATQQKLYANLDVHIPAGTPITSDRTRAALADLNSDIAGAPELSKWFKNARIQGIEGGLKSDTTSLEAVLSRPGVKQQVTQMQSQLEAEAARATSVNAERRMLGMNNMEPVLTPAQIKDQIDGFLSKQVDSRLPYESIKKLRTLVGRELADGSLVADVPRSKWIALYAALTDDLGVAAKNAGPEAEKSWNWANQYTKSQMGRLEQLSSIVAKDSPEKIFGAATAGTLEGDTIIKRVISALPKQERREVAAAVLQRMGRATAGQQNAMGDAFSSETFLTNLSKLSPASRRTLFGRTDVKGIEAQVEQFAKVSDMRRAGGRVFANPSGTAASGAQLVNAAAIGSGITASVASGNPLPLAGALMAPAAANLGARFMTNPNVVKKLAQTTVLPEGARAVVVGAASRLDSADQPPQAPASANPQIFSFEDAQMPAAPAQPESEDAARIELNGMAPAFSLEPESAPQETDAEGDTIDPSATQGAAEADPAQAFTSVQRPDGTLAISGDPQALHATLVASGIPARSIVRNAAGVMVGRSQAGRVQEAIARMGQPGSEEIAGIAPAAVVAENQPMMVPPAGQGGLSQADPQMAGMDPATPATGMEPDHDQMALSGPSIDGVQPSEDAQGAPVYAQNEQSVLQNPAPDAQTGELYARAPELAGQPIDGNWTAFSPESGTLRVPRAEMPQIKAEHRGAMVSFLKARGIDSQQGEVPADSLKPTQAEFSPEKVARAAAFEGGNRSILISSDGHVLDGHHQWLAKRETGDPVKVTQLGAPIAELLGAVREFPSAGASEGAMPQDPTQQAAASGDMLEPTQAEPAAEPVHPMVARIQRLKDAGEDQVAKMLQRNHDREQTLGAVQTELAGMRESAPDLPHHQNAHFQSAYQQQRVAGAKPAEAAARAGILAAVQETAPGAGMPEKAVAALQAKLGQMPVDEAPGFVQRFTQALIAKGVMQSFQGSDQIEQMLARARDGSMNAMVDSAYRSAVG